MNLTVTSSPSTAELARSVLEHRTLVAGQPFYAAGTGVVVIVAPLPPEEAAACGADHEFTISTGFPPDPAAAGITVWVQRRDQTGGHLDRLGETDRFGSIVFAAGAAGAEYQMTVTRGSSVRLAMDGAAILPFPAPSVDRPELEGVTCPVCCAAEGDWIAKLTGMRDGLSRGIPICRGHLSGPENVILAAARNAWQHNTPEVFAACARLLADLLDEPGAVRKGFLSLFPADSHNRALNQVAGLLSTAIAVGHVLSKNPGRATAAGRAATVHLQSLAGSGRPENDPVPGRVNPADPQPLEGLLARMTARLKGGLMQGFLEFRRLSASITQHSGTPG